MTRTRIAFLSDIHSNLEALEATSKSLDVDHVIVLGDSIGYGPNPNEVIEWVRSNADACIRGNHEEAVATRETSWFNRVAALAIDWTRRQLTDANLSFISSLPSSMVWESPEVKILLVHGSPLDPLYEYVYESTHSSLFEYYLERFRVGGVALGHTHMPFIWDSARGLIVNPGSVGQPRDGDNRASHAVLEIEDGIPAATNYRVSYDIEKTAEKIRYLGLPEMLASRLYLGR